MAAIRTLSFSSHSSGVWPQTFRELCLPSGPPGEYRLPRGGRRSDCRCRAFAALPWYQPLSEDLGHEGVHHLGRLPLYIVGDVGVGVQGEAGLGVVQDAGAGLGIHADGQSFYRNNIRKFYKLTIKNRSTPKDTPIVRVS